MTNFLCRFISKILLCVIMTLDRDISKYIAKYKNIRWLIKLEMCNIVVLKLYLKEFLMKSLSCLMVTIQLCDPLFVLSRYTSHTHKKIGERIQQSRMSLLYVCTYISIEENSLPTNWTSSVY